MPLILPHLVGSHAGCLEGEIDLSRLAVDVKTIPITCQKYRWYMILQKKTPATHTSIAISNWIQLDLYDWVYPFTTWMKGLPFTNPSPPVSSLISSEGPSAAASPSLRHFGETRLGLGGSATWIWYKDTIYKWIELNGKPTCYHLLGPKHLYLKAFQEKSDHPQKTRQRLFKVWGQNGQKRSEIMITFPHLSANLWAQSQLD